MKKHSFALLCSGYAQHYHPEYMGHTLQNEKLGMFVVLAIDRFSSKIVAEVTLPVKNSPVISEEV